MHAKRKLPALALSASLIALTGCAIPISEIEAVTDTSCQSFRPIHGSRRDTEDTRRQVVSHNAAWVSVCADKGEAPRQPSAPAPPAEVASAS